MKNFLERMKIEAEAKAKVYAQIGLDAMNENPSVKAEMIAHFGHSEKSVQQYVERLKKQAI